MAFVGSDRFWENSYDSITIFKSSAFGDVTTIRAGCAVRSINNVKSVRMTPCKKKLTYSLNKSTNSLEALGGQ